MAKMRMQTMKVIRAALILSLNWREALVRRGTPVSIFRMSLFEVADSRKPFFTKISNYRNPLFITTCRSH